MQKEIEKLKKAEGDFLSQMLFPVYPILFLKEKATEQEIFVELMTMTNSFNKLKKVEEDFNSSINSFNKRNNSSIRKIIRFFSFITESDYIYATKRVEEIKENTQAKKSEFLNKVKNAIINKMKKQNDLSYSIDLIEKSEPNINIFFKDNDSHCKIIDLLKVAVSQYMVSVDNKLDEDNIKSLRKRIINIYKREIEKYNLKSMEEMQIISEMIGVCGTKDNEKENLIKEFINVHGFDNQLNSRFILEKIENQSKFELCLSYNKHPMFLYDIGESLSNLKTTFSAIGYHSYYEEIGANHDDNSLHSCATKRNRSNEIIFSTISENKRKLIEKSVQLLLEYYNLILDELKTVKSDKFENKKIIKFLDYLTVENNTKDYNELSMSIAKSFFKKNMREIHLMYDLEFSNDDEKQKTIRKKI